MASDPGSNGVPIGTSHLTKKRRIRGGHKAYVTTAITKCKEILAKFIPEDSLGLKTEKISLEEKLTTMKGLDDQILDLIEKEDEIQHEINQLANFSKGIHEILIQIQEKLSGLTLQTSNNANGNGNSDSSGASSGSHGGAGIYTKIPTLELRKFFGKAHRFQEFWDSFRVSVDNNKTLSPAIKLEYLKTQCEVPTYQAIAGVELSDANY